MCDPRLNHRQSLEMAFRPERDEPAGVARFRRVGASLGWRAKRLDARCSTVQSPLRSRWDEYLALERESPFRHSFLDGEIHAMAAATPEHAALEAVILRELGALLRKRACRAFSSNLSVKVQATGLTTYPDASVVCGELKRDRSARNVVLDPTVLVEVTGDSTDGHDRGEKFEHYRAIPELAEYVLVSHRERLIEVFRRTAEGPWARVEARRVRLESIECELDVDSLYDGIALHGE